MGRRLLAPWGPRIPAAANLRAHAIFVVCWLRALFMKPRAKTQDNRNSPYSLSLADLWRREHAFEDNPARGLGPFTAVPAYEMRKAKSQRTAVQSSVPC